MTTVDNLQALPVSGPRAPDISKKQLLTQFRADIYGKEVQDAVTYSYVWLADQMGHVCLGIVINFILTYLLKWLLGLLGLAWSWDKIGVLLIGTAIVAFWEFCAFRSAVKSATGLFTLDQPLSLSLSLSLSHESIVYTHHHHHHHHHHHLHLYS